MSDHPRPLGVDPAAAARSRAERRAWIWLFALFALIGALLAQASRAVDNDADGLDDSYDACSNDNEGSSTNRCDTDADGYGNRCDGDFNQSNTVTAADYSMFFVPALDTGTDSGRGEDMNCSDGPPGGQVTAADYSMFFVPQLAAPSIPGPSGLACRGHENCRANMEARVVELVRSGTLDNDDGSSDNDITVSEPFHFASLGAGGDDPQDSEQPPGYPFRAEEGVLVRNGAGGDHVADPSGMTALPYAWTAIVNGFQGKGLTPTWLGWLRVNKTQDVTSHTSCGRFYFQYSPGFASNDTTNVNLATNYTFGSSTNDPGVRFTWNSGTLELHTGIESTPFGAHSTNPVALSGAGVTRGECSDEWCFFESCYDHDVGGDDKLRVRAQLRILTGVNAGDTDMVSVTLPNAVSTAVSGSQWTGPALEKQTGSFGSWLNSSEYLVWANSAWVELGSVDTTFWIGPADEVEIY